AAGGRGGPRRAPAGRAGPPAAPASRRGLIPRQRRLAADPAPPRPAVAIPPAADAAPVRRTAHIRREGDVWTIACDGELTRLKETKGIAYLLALLRHPGQEFHALDLGGAEDLPAGDGGAPLAAAAPPA